jgi:hypothetical protein
MKDTMLRDPPSALDSGAPEFPKLSAPLAPLGVAGGQSGDVGLSVIPAKLFSKNFFSEVPDSHHSALASGPPTCFESTYPPVDLPVTASNLNALDRILN